MFVRPLVREGAMIRPMNAGDGFAANSNMALVEATATLTVSQVLGGHIFHGITGAATYTLPTAALLAAAMPDMDIGDSISILVTNAQAAANVVTVAVGTGITAKGTNNSLTVVGQSSRVFTLVKTAAATFDLY